jgi:dipeptidase
MTKPNKKSPLKKSLSLPTPNIFLILLLGITLIAGPGPSDYPEEEIQGCTVIGAGKSATVDGSVITSHSDCCSECRVHVVPGKTFKKGEMVPVYWGMVHFGSSDDRGGRPLGDYGTVIGEIPQVERTYTYFHTGYSQINEHQLAIGESTCSQKRELNVAYVEGLTSQILTIEQAQVFALQRCVKSKDAVKLIGGLIERYGFLPSCGGAEALCIADPEEVWVMEIFSVGPEWTPESGKPGAIWAARRVPDDHVTVIPNYVRIRKIDLSHPDFIASSNYKQEAIDRGWYDPDSSMPFLWQEAYAPPIKEGSLGRLYYIYSTLAPQFKDWPRKRIDGPTSGATHYGQGYEGAEFYPFSVKPEKKVSVKDIIAFQRSVMKGTVYDMEADRVWLVPGSQGKYIKSPLASPFPSQALKELLNITIHRNIASQGYGMVAQLRSWLPDPIGGIYWFYVDNPHVSTYVPIYIGVKEIAQAYKTYDIRKYEEESARWAVDFVENLMQLRWQSAIKDLQALRSPLEGEFFSKQEEVEKVALTLYKKNPAKAIEYLTELTKIRMNNVVKMYHKLRDLLITKYGSNNY